MSDRYDVVILGCGVKHIPPLDPEFIPLMRFNHAFLSGAKKPVGIAVERADGQMASCHTFIHGTPEMAEADHYYIERLVKTLLWMKALIVTQFCPIFNPLPADRCLLLVNVLYWKNRRREFPKHASRRRGRTSVPSRPDLSGRKEHP